MDRTWPEDWEARKRGDDCPFCGQGRVEADEFGVRFFSGRVSDAYLQRKAPAPGYAIVVFRGRHVADPTGFTLAEMTAFWTEVQSVARVIDRVFSPCHLNYQLLGNAVPHVHVHLVPRYLDDPAPERPLPFELKPVPADEFARQLEALQAADLSGPVIFPNNHHGLTADVFVIREGRFLVLTRAGGLGEGVEYIPGGIVDPGEDPFDAAVRETKEETGLDVRDAALLRVWAYPSGEGWETVHATYVGYSDAGDVVITPEHTAHRWVTPDEHIDRWCREEFEETFPQFATFFQQVRRNCELVRQYLG